MFHSPAETTQQTLNNTYYRHVIEFTSQYAFVLMSIPYGQGIPKEMHEKAVQFTRLEGGTCSVIRNGKKEKVPEEGRFFIPHGVYHTVINDDIEKRTLKIYNVYIPPPPGFYEGLIHKTQTTSKDSSSSGFADLLF